MIEKPIAHLTVFFGSDTGWQYDCKLLDGFDTEEYLNSIEGVIVCLFTESQLKAERERAINECLEIAERYLYEDSEYGQCACDIKRDILKLLDN
jgi:hypothetical protein